MFSPVPIELVRHVRLEHIPKILGTQPNGQLSKLRGKRVGGLGVEEHMG